LKSSNKRVYFQFLFSYFVESLVLHYQSVYKPQTLNEKVFTYVLQHKTPLLSWQVQKWQSSVIHWSSNSCFLPL